jgi:hypothetical protein
MWWRRMPTAAAQPTKTVRFGQLARLFNWEQHGGKVWCQQVLRRGAALLLPAHAKLLLDGGDLLPLLDLVHLAHGLGGLQAREGGGEGGGAGAVVH